MSRLRKSSLAAASALAPALLAACGSGEPKEDPAAVDRHLNQIVSRKEAEKQRLVEEARAREEVRVREMEQNAENYSEAAD